MMSLSKNSPWSKGFNKCEHGPNLEISDFVVFVQPGQHRCYSLSKRNRGSNMSAHVLNLLYKWGKGINAAARLAVSLMNSTIQE